MNEIPFMAWVDGRQPAVVRLVGELDLAAAPQLESILSALDGDVELDCSRLDFIDAAGLRAFQNAQAACTARGCELVLVEPSPAVDRIMGAVELDAMFLVRLASEAS